jgi:hypothetical protein
METQINQKLQFVGFKLKLKKNVLCTFKGSRGDKSLSQSQGSSFGFKNPLKGNTSIHK